ncbi:MAG: glycosyl hydrolase 115 family protein, partial [Chitinophagaceae bacterium]
PSSYRPAFFQLVLYPTAACANLNDLYVTAAKNRLYAKQGRPMTNVLADSAVAMFKEDHILSHFYNKVMENGRWNHMMDQTHIGYTYWQEPPWNVMPQVVRIQLPDMANMGVAVQGSDLTLPVFFWFRRKTRPALPVFDPYSNQQQYYLDIFDRGEIPFHYQVKADKKWIQITQPEGEISKQQRIWISVDWKQAPHGKDSSLITITGPDNRPVQVTATIDNPVFPPKNEIKGFVESNGYVSMEAPHYSKVVNSDSVHWVTIPGLGRTLSAVTAFPVTASSKTPGGKSPHLEYDMYLFDTGDVKVEAYLSPTLNFKNSPQGLRYAVSFDNNPPLAVNMTADASEKTWAEHVSDNINIQTTEFHIEKPGEHILKFWRVDPGVVLQKIVVDLGGVKQSYLGPPESYYKK